MNKKKCDNIVGKCEKAVNQHSLLLPRCLLPFSYKFVVENALNFEISKILSFFTGLGNGLLERNSRDQITIHDGILNPGTFLYSNVPCWCPVDFLSH